MVETFSCVHRSYPNVKFCSVYHLLTGKLLCRVLGFFFFLMLVFLTFSFHTRILDCSIRARAPFLRVLVILCFKNKTLSADFVLSNLKYTYFPLWYTHFNCDFFFVYLFVPVVNNFESTTKFSCNFKLLCNFAAVD